MTVWVLVIEHKHGFNHYAHRTEAGAMKTLAEYVAEWWSEVSTDPMPDDPAEAVKIYFEDHQSEWYTLEEVNLAD